MEKIIRFPDGIQTVGQKIKFLSETLVPSARFEEYLALMGSVLSENIHYIDTVHELRDRTNVIAMLKKYLPRVANEHYSFELISDGDRHVVWRWTIGIKVRFTPFVFRIHGLVHAETTDGMITYQREYYDPMESITVIPMLGFLYKLVLRMG